MALRAIEADLPLSLDDFIPPHLQRKARPPDGDTPPRQISPGKNDRPYKATMVFMSEDTDEDAGSPQIERRWIRYDGIGPTDDDGMPFASRSSVDKPREWYKNMFKVLHQLSDSEDSDSEGHRQRQAHNMKESLRGVNKQQDQMNKPRQETSQLHITIKSKESQNAVSKVQTSPGPSSISSRSPGLSSQPLTLARAAEMHQFLDITSEGPNLTSSSMMISKPKQPLQTEVNSHYQPEPASSYSSSYRTSSRAPKLSPISPSLSKEEISPTKSPKGKEKYSAFTVNSSDQCIRSPTRRSTTKMLDQLETDLRQFTEELDRDMEARKQRTESLEACEEVVLRRSSGKEADGSHEPTLKRSNGRSNTEDLETLTPIAQAVVKFDFVAQKEKELSLQRGSKVYILKIVDQNWLLGEHDGRRGLFPESYVKVVPPGDDVDTPQLTAIALYDFKADSDAEIPLRKGQHVLITRRVGGSWFEGRVEDSPRLGLFPASYVQITKNGPLPQKGDSRSKVTKDAKPAEQVSAGFTLKEKPCIVKAPVFSKLNQLQGTVYRARFSFTPSNPDELQLQTGDVVTVTEQCDDGWYVGVCWRTQQFGTFPGNYVVPYETP